MTLLLTAACQSDSADPAESLLPAVEPQAGGQTGAIGPDEVRRFAVGDDEPTPLGFSAGQVRERLAGTHSATLEYADGRPSSTVTLQVTLGEGAELTDDFGRTSAQLYEDLEAYDSEDALVMSAQVRLATDDGAFDEQQALGELRITEGLVGQFWMEQPVAALQGDYEYPVPGGGFVRSGSWFVYFTVDAAGGTRGTMTLLNASPYYEGDRQIAAWRGESTPSTFTRVADDVPVCELVVDRGPAGADTHRC